MESRGILRNILIALVGFGILLLIIVIIVRLFSGGGDGGVRNSFNITDYANRGASAVVLVDEPTNSDLEHYQVRITVSESQNMIETFTGYQQTAKDSRTYPNNSAAFTTFLETLQLMGYSNGTDLKVDYRGYCPTANRYVFSFNDGNTERFERWATSCSGQGTFKGQKTDILRQFRLQIPQKDFNQLTSGITLGF